MQFVQVKAARLPQTSQSGSAFKGGGADDADDECAEAEAESEAESEEEAAAGAADVDEGVGEEETARREEEPTSSPPSRPLWWAATGCSKLRRSFFQCSSSSWM